MAEIRHLENRHDVIFFCWGWSDFDKISQTGTEWRVDCGGVWKWKPDVEFQYGGRLGEFDGMSSQSHVSHCRVLPVGEFTVTIPEPHATLQGVRIPSAILKIVFRHILFLFLFLTQFRLWRAAAFVSSPMHLFYCLSGSVAGYTSMCDRQSWHEARVLISRLYHHHHHHHHYPQHQQPASVYVTVLIAGARVQHTWFQSKEGNQRRVSFW